MLICYALHNYIIVSILLTIVNCERENKFTVDTQDHILCVLCGFFLYDVISILIYLRINILILLSRYLIQITYLF